MCVCVGGGGGMKEGEAEETNTVLTLQEISFKWNLPTVCI